MLFAFAAAAVCIVGAQLVFMPHIRFIVAGEIACLVSILVGLEWGRRAHLQQRWLAARYLAERLRSEFFLALIGAEQQSSATVVLSKAVPVALWIGIASTCSGCGGRNSIASALGEHPLRRDPSTMRRHASRNWMFCALHTMRLREGLVETESALYGLIEDH